jgi:hypothetical protein
MLLTVENKFSGTRILRLAQPTLSHTAPSLASFLPDLFSRVFGYPAGSSSEAIRHTMGPSFSDVIGEKSLYLPTVTTKMTLVAP